MSNNRISSVLLECTNPDCGLKYQAIISALRRCAVCEGTLQPVAKRFICQKCSQVWWADSLTHGRTCKCGGDLAEVPRV